MHLGCGTRQLEAELLGLIAKPGVDAVDAFLGTLLQTPDVKDAAIAALPRVVDGVRKALGLTSRRVLALTVTIQVSR